LVSAASDGRLIQAARKDSIQSVENGKRKIIRDDYTGKVEKVDAGLLNILLENGYLPVIAPMAVSQKGEALNIDADGRLPVSLLPCRPRPWFC